MSAQSPDPRYDEWPVDGHEETAEFVGLAGVGGTTGGVTPIYYEQDDEVFFGADLDEENQRLMRRSDQEWDLEPFDSIGDGVEHIGEELGWDSLSAFAEDHLEDDD